jgi:hypothetical protein
MTDHVSPLRTRPRRLRAGAVAVAITIALTSLIGVAPASATYQGTLCNGLGTWRVKPWNYNSTWQTPMNDGWSTWNASAKLNIIKDSGVTSAVTVGSYSADWYGYYTYNSNGVRSIQMNSRTINLAATNFTNWVRSTFTHELGHGFCLADNPSTSSSSLMKHTRNRSTVYVPQTYDWNDINAHF